MYCPSCRESIAGIFGDGCDGCDGTKHKAVTFDMTLFDDASVAEKLTVMNPLEVVFDDSRNDVPDEYYDIVDLKPGQTLRITVEVCDD